MKLITKHCLIISFLFVLIVSSSCGIKDKVLNIAHSIISSDSTEQVDITTSEVDESEEDTTDDFTRQLNANKKLVLRDIQFEYNSDEFKPISYPTLEKLLATMQNSSVKILISGHSSFDKGDIEEENQYLSEIRAAAVYYYLSSNGISKERMQYEGKGSSEPIASNDTKAGREQNRRVEIKVLK